MKVTNRTKNKRKAFFRSGSSGKSADTSPYTAHDPNAQTFTVAESVTIPENVEFIAAQTVEEHFGLPEGSFAKDMAENPDPDAAVLSAKAAGEAAPEVKGSVDYDDVTDKTVTTKTPRKKSATPKAKVEKAAPRKRATKAKVSVTKPA